MFNPDVTARRMGAHTYEIEELDLSAHGWPGLSFSGLLRIEPDPDAEGEWYVDAVTSAKGAFIYVAPHQRDLRGADIARAIVAAVQADEYWRDCITDASYEAGED